MRYRNCILKTTENTTKNDKQFQIIQFTTKNVQSNGRKKHIPTAEKTHNILHSQYNIVQRAWLWESVLSSSIKRTNTGKCENYCKIANHNNKSTPMTTTTTKYVYMIAESYNNVCLYEKCMFSLYKKRLNHGLFAGKNDQATRGN